MRKLTTVLLLFVVILLSCGYSVNADETDDFGVHELYDSTDKETKILLDDLGIDDIDEIDNFTVESILELLSDLFRDKYVSPFRCLALATSIIVISSAISAWDKNSEVFSGLAGGLAVCGIYIPYIAVQITSAVDVSETIMTFVMAAVPIYSVLHIASGYTTLGTTYGTASLMSANILTALSTNFILPSLSIFLGLSVSACFSHINIKNISKSIYNAIKYVLVLSVTIFSGILSVQSAVAGATDAATTKTMKFIAGTTVPVVGSAFGDGVTAIRHSVTMLKTGAGAFGIIVCLLTFLPILTELVLWLASIQISLIIADIFSAPKIKEFLEVIALIIKTIIAVVLSLAVISIVTSAITLSVGA